MLRFVSRETGTFVEDTGQNFSRNLVNGEPKNDVHNSRDKPFNFNICTPKPALPNC